MCYRRLLRDALSGDDMLICSFPFQGIYVISLHYYSPFLGLLCSNGGKITLLTG